MPNPTSCTHIKVSGVRCGSPALRGEQFCYFHQQAHRGVRRPPFARLHPIAMLEDPESIQASLMEVVNGLVRNTLDVKRAELIIRALNIATKNARNVRFDSQAYPKVKEVPAYPAPAAEIIDWTVPESQRTAVDPEAELPAIAAKPPRPVDPSYPHQHEYSEEGVRFLARQAAAERTAQTRATVASENTRVPSETAPVATAAPGRPVRAATANREADPAKPKPPVSAKPSPHLGKNVAQPASAG